MNYKDFFDCLEQTRLSPWSKALFEVAQRNIKESNNGDLPKWLSVLDELPSVSPSCVDVNLPAVTIGKKEDYPSREYHNLEPLLRRLHPWRKGPFDLFGIYIDTEWRSDMKWDRLKNDISSLKDRLVLDIGCGNGYHCFRMLEQNPRLVMGIDFTLLYVIQFHVFNFYAKQKNVSVLSLGIDDMPRDMDVFDTVFSMGLLYHRRAPLDHLLQLRSFLRDGGELVLDTLVIDGKEGDALSPAERYAKMPNVWFIPSVPTLKAWLKRMGFRDIRLVDVSRTDSEEQRATGWMNFQSLKDFLDPGNPSLTVEGYPAPQRAVFCAKK